MRVLISHSLKGNLALFQFAIRHGLSGKAFNELLLLLASHLPQSAKCSTSVYRLKKFFVEHFSDVKAHLKHYCSVCHDMLDSEEPFSHEACATAGSVVREFVTVPLGPQMKKMMEGISIRSVCIVCCLTLIN